MKIIFMGTPDFAVPALESLYNSGHCVGLVITQKDRPKGRGKKVQYTPVKEKALELGIEVFQPEDVNSTESVSKLRSVNPDVIVVVAYGQILKDDILNISFYGCINIHASILPKYRGAAPINWAIMNGEKETGITIMKMNEGLDTGDILLAESVTITMDDDYISMHNKLAQLGSILIVDTLKMITDGTITHTPQDDSLSSYAPMIYKDTGRIRWDRPGEQIFKQVMGLKPWPCAHTKYYDDIIKIYKVRVAEKIRGYEPGVIIKVLNDGIYVNAADSCIIIEELQFPGKKRLNIREYLAGNSIEQGVLLK